MFAVVVTVLLLCLLQVFKMTTKRKNPPRKATKTTPKTSTSTSRASAVVNYMGCNLTEAQKKRWRALTLPKRTIRVTKFFDRDALSQLGVLESVEVLLRRAGLSEFLNKRADTYKRLTLEFLSTIEQVPDSDPPSIKFQLMNKETVLSHNTLREIFGVAPREDTESWVGPSWAATNEFWYALTHERSDGHTPKSSKIPHPAFRFIHRVLVMTFLCQGEPTNITRSEIKMLWGMGPEGVGRPDWVTEFIEECVAIQKVTTGKIAMGGMVTLIATHLGYELDPRDQIRGTPVLDIDSMCCHMKMLVRLDCEELAYALQLGTVLKTPYLRLPRPEGVLIPVGPRHSDLFIPMDPPELLVLDASKTNTEADDGEDIAMEEAGGLGRDENEEEEADVGEGPSSRADLGDATWRARVELDLEELWDKIESVHDETRECLALQRAMSDMFTTMYPSSYTPPAVTFYEELAKKRLARGARARARQTRRFGSPSS